MRDIKFRIWDSKEKEWLGTSDKNSLKWYGFGLVGECMTVQAPPQWALDKGMIAEEYTGIKDDAGQEIYEGDILQDFDNDCYFKVVWDRGLFAIISIEPVPTMEILGDISTDGLEVIGNIHENPELLKEEK